MLMETGKRGACSSRKIHTMVRRYLGYRSHSTTIFDTPLQTSSVNIANNAKNGRLPSRF